MNLYQLLIIIITQRLSSLYFLLVLKESSMQGITNTLRQYSKQLIKNIKKVNINTSLDVWQGRQLSYPNYKDFFPENIT